MAHSVEEQQYILTRDRIRDGELPFLKSAFENDGWLKIFSGTETYFLMACYYRQSCVIDYLLTKASENIHKEEVKAWLNIVSPNESTPLHNYLCLSTMAYRAKRRHDGLPILTSILQKLVKIGFNVNQSNSYGETPLFLAVTNNDVLSVETMIHLGADPNTKCCVLQETALHQGCMSSQNEMLKVLLNVPGIDINTQNSNGLTPIHLACQRDDVLKLNMLLNSGCSIEVQSEKGDTPIFFSLQKPNNSNNSQITCFEVLFDHINKTMSPEDACVHLSHQNKRNESLIISAVKHRNITALKLLLDNLDLFDVHAKDAEDRSLLHLCIIHAPDKDVLEYLLEKGLSPNNLDQHGNTPMMYFFKKVRCVQRQPVRVNIPNMNV